MREAPPTNVVPDPEPGGIGEGSAGVTKGWTVVPGTELKNRLLWAGGIPDRNALSLTNHDSGAARVGFHAPKTRQRSSASRLTPDNDVGMC